VPAITERGSWAYRWVRQPHADWPTSRPQQPLHVQVLGCALGATGPIRHGLSDTTFGYDSHRHSAYAWIIDSIVVRVRVRNSGRRAGDEVVQLYLGDEAASFTRPVQALRGFHRIALAPGEAHTVSFTLGPADFALPGRI
jgi:hypothetical protein